MPEILKTGVFTSESIPVLFCSTNGDFLFYWRLAWFVITFTTHGRDSSIRRSWGALQGVVFSYAYRLSYRIPFSRRIPIMFTSTLPLICSFLNRSFDRIRITCSIRYLDSIRNVNNIFLEGEGLNFFLARLYRIIFYWIGL